jgi:prevent-host-death family protein
MALIDDIKPVSELKAQTKKLIDQVRATHRPVVITVKGKAVAVLMDAAEYDRQRQALRLASLLATGEEDARAGRFRPALQFLKELERAGKGSR